MSAGAFRGALLAAAGHPARVHQTDQPVWRSSYDVDDPRAKVARPLGDGTKEGAKVFISQWIRVAGEWSKHVRQPGRLRPITGNMREFLREMMWGCIDRATGACEVTIDRIVEVTQVCRETVIRYLKKLRELGWIDWVRRTVKTGNAPGEGPQVKQTANAYFFEISKLPIEARRRLHQHLGARHAMPEYPERQGSGPVPNRMARAASAMVRGLGNLWRAPAAGRRVDADRLALSEAANAHLLDPENVEKQRVYDEFLKRVESPSASVTLPTDPPVKNKG